MVLVSWVALVSPLCAAGPVVLLVGPPGSGRAAQAQMLRKQYGMAVISADDLIAKNQPAFQRLRTPGLQQVDPRLDLALNKLVEEALRSADLTNGVVLDGYPAAKAQADFLAGLREKLHLPRALVIHLRIPDEVVRKRLKKQAPADLEQQLKDYHREIDFAREYFPQADIHDVDAAKKPAAVAKQIRQLLLARAD